VFNIFHIWLIVATDTILHSYVYTHWHDGHLPTDLLAFFQVSHIHKVDIKISSDLKWLFNDCQFGDNDQAFSGALDLGAFAKACNATMKANVELADLPATVLC